MVNKNKFCRVSETLVVKVGDFGLSSDLYNKDYFRLDSYEDPLPVRWLAVEVMTEMVFSVSSDVVSTAAFVLDISVFALSSVFSFELDYV